MKKVAINTLGCKANQLESSILADDLVKYGFEVVKFNEIADFYIINTCSVTGKSDNNSRYYIRQAKRRNPAARIIVTGCYAQVAAEEIRQLEDVNLIIGNTEKQNLVELLNNNELFDDSEPQILVSDIMQEKEFKDKKVLSASGRTRANIKIQDGCNFRCSYCIVPYARGNSRSNNLNDILEQVELITGQGFQELVLSGIHLGQWGLDLKPKSSLANLIKEIEQVEGLKRFRLSSIDPIEFTDDLIETLINSKKFCRHLHISLQSGNNEILKLMRRRYSVEYYSDLINNLTKNIPNLAIGSDIIVGFPGETDEFFNDTYKNLENLPISYIHVFTYSKRKGTPAAEMENQIPQGIKKIRNNMLTELAAGKNLEFRKSQLNQELEVLIELTRDKKTGLLKGRSDNYIPVLINGKDDLKNKLIKIVITEIDQVTTKGEILI
ncbi:MAG: tRNA (N(6)-L-threonylcarbamoyladenosine(37)-C(2))-methylthiotransferase MtaB [Candidatus Melainabacteria bacterium RIFOXYA2_FULL_32_9]|nr:MAG: tRNA (N(6)-L-threonylcarbamoyladenosine(37)-C(2))-methylthiotransferase MtaB [Candidatus Melainabacteria bacterium RIFOXYA2_FULL_32_9]